ncbi:MAG: ATP-dependent helicase [Kiritimatiellae bacterium]|nr:ATP-dependent helicase [Kiritimatiellia bacterium]
MIDFAQELNEEQLAAVTASDGPLLVLAAAGTGKTRTLVYRVAYLVEQGVDAHRILLLTFTNKAAHEMLERADRLVGGRVGGLWGGTFHHMANRMLRRHAAALGFPSDYTILDRDDSVTLIRACLKELKLTRKDFPKAPVLLSVFGKAANTQQSAESVAEAHFEETPIDVDEVLNVHKAYVARKQALAAMDFDDLLVNGLRLFREHAEVLARYQEHFLYVLVDEYQDTNCIQAQWVDLIAARHRNLLVVGDDFQSIYSWRGADFRNILSFPERYPGTRIFKLETNYRSVPEILAVANACIAGNPEQFQKVMRATRDAYKKPVLVRLRDGAQQARYVVEQIRRLQREGYSLNEMAVLYRAHFHAMELQSQLARERIPYVITSGVRFFEQAHIKDVCSLLRVVYCPHDEMAFTRLLALFPGVGHATAGRLWRKLGGRFEAGKEPERRLVEAALPRAAKTRWAALEEAFALLDEREQDGANDGDGENGENGADAENLGGRLIEAFVEGFYRRYAVENFENAQVRLDDVNELAAFAGRFQSMEAFLSEVALLTNLDAEIESMTREGGEYLRLSTVHQAKGLEWKVVFILWLADGLFPSGRSMMESEGGESEERRLFYVSVTRAKDEVYLCVPELRQTRDRNVFPVAPSRFVDEIPRKLLKTEQAWLV